MSMAVFTVERVLPANSAPHRADSAFRATATASAGEMESQATWT